MPSQTHRVHTVHSRSEFDAVMQCQWAGFTRQDKFWDVWFPIDKTAYLGKPRPDLEGAIKESCDRMWAEHQEDPSSTWIYITEDGNKIDSDPPGEETTPTTQPPLVAGSCQWRVYAPPKNPFPGNQIPDVRCPAWQGDEIGDEVASAVIRSIITPRIQRMARPHIGLSWMAVRPTHRRNGVGKALMHWGQARADELALESYLEASSVGRLLYSECGFRDVGVYICRIPVVASSNTESEEHTQKLKAFTKAFGFDEDYIFTSMWRPPNGQWRHSVEPKDLLQEYTSQSAAREEGN